MTERRRPLKLEFSSLEEELLNKGRIPFVGVDEVGRGPLAGPVVAAAVIWDYTQSAGGIKDSKLLISKKRQHLSDYILSKAKAVSIGWASPAEIDSYNVLQASFLAMSRALNLLEVTPILILVDGNMEIPSLAVEQLAIKGGDAKITAISAASIVAKVARDNLMIYMDSQYPGYGFSRHMGYPTKEHRKAIRDLGPCPIHRKTFKGVLFD